MHFLQTILDFSTLQMRIQRPPHKGHVNQSQLDNGLGFVVGYKTNNQCEYIAHTWRIVENDAHFLPPKLPLQLLLLQSKKLGDVIALQIGRMIEGIFRNHLDKLSQKTIGYIKRDSTLKNDLDKVATESAHVIHHVACMVSFFGC
jgi:hypothetical protein